MNKFISLALTAVLLISAITLLTLTASAGGEHTMTYGAASIELTLIEDFQTAEANPSYGWGAMTAVDGMLKIETTQAFVDAYEVQGHMVSGGVTFAGAENFVFSVKNNRSDGDTFFCFQPHDTTVGNLYLGIMEDHPVLLIDEKGKVTEAKHTATPDLVNGRYAYVVPMGFEGYIVIPSALLVMHNQWDTPYYKTPDAVSLDSLGFHMAPDDATYVEMCIDDIFTCGALPAYEEPKPETAAPTEAPTQPDTVPETAAPTAPVDTAVPETDSLVTEMATTFDDTILADTLADGSVGTSADTAVGTETPEKNGCFATITVSVALLPFLAAATLFFRKREID